MTQPRSYLADRVGKSPANDDELRRMAAAAWHQRGTLVVHLDELRNETDRLMAESIGAKLYGKRQVRR